MQGRVKSKYPRIRDVDGIQVALFENVVINRRVENTHHELHQLVYGSHIIVGTW